jgi:outer membrane protein assembly factor BamB
MSKSFGAAGGQISLPADRWPRLGASSIAPAGSIALLPAVLVAGALSLLVGGDRESPVPHPQHQTHAAAAAALGSSNLAAAASSEIGAARHRFWPTRHGTTLQARGGDIVTKFGARGASLSARRATLRLSTARLGRGEEIAPSEEARPEAIDNTVRYRHDGFTERYRNGPLGLEQTFMVGARPRGNVAPLVISLRTTGSLSPVRSAAGIVFRDAHGAAVLRDGGLRATDASGRALPAKMRVRGRVVELRIDDAGARYPLQVDPFIEQAEIPGRGFTTFGGGHHSVALSADGDTALVGAWVGEGGGGGEAWVFTKSGSTWSAQAQLEPVNGGSRGFGETVALSADGDTALVADPGGGVWVFVRSGSTWTRQTEDPLRENQIGGEEEGGARFGSSVALSADGDTALIGGPLNGAHREGGAVWVYTRTETHWARQGRILQPAEESSIAGREFGSSVALSADGDTALIGAEGDDRGVGAAWTFERTGGEWVQRGSKLSGAGETGRGLFGYAVALSADGTTALIGAPGDSFGAGGAWAFTRSGASWTAQGHELIPAADPEGANFGTSLAISSDGSTALIGGPSDGPLAEGSAWVFGRGSPSWSQMQKLTDPQPSREVGFGQSVALSPDATTALVGAPVQKGTLGAVWTFTSPPWGPPQAEAPGPAPDSGPTWSTLGGDSAHTASVDSSSLHPPFTVRWSHTFPVDSTAKPSKGIVEGKEVDDPLDQVVSYPLIGDGLVFFMQYDTGYPENEQIDAYSEQTGGLVWSYLPPPGEGGEMYLALDAGRLFVDSTSIGVVAFDARTGAKLWTRGLSSRAEPMIASEGVLYYVEGNSGAYALAVEEATGRELWEEDIYSHPRGGPVLANGNVYLMGADETHPVSERGPTGMALSAKTGEPVWEDFTGSSGLGCSWTTIFAESRLWTTQCRDREYEPTLGDIVDPANGASEGTYPSSARNGPVIDGHEQIGLVERYECASNCTLASTTLTAEDWTAGKTLWSFSGDGQLDAGVIRVGEDVYAGSSSGMLYAVDAHTGEQTWSMQMPDGFRPEYTGISAAGLAAAGDALAVTAGDSLTLLTTGAEAEAPATPDPGPVSPAPIEPAPGSSTPTPDAAQGTAAGTSGSPSAAPAVQAGAVQVAGSRQARRASCSLAGAVHIHALAHGRLRVQLAIRCGAPLRATATLGYRRPATKSKRGSRRSEFVALARKTARIAVNPTRLTFTLSASAAHVLGGARPIVDIEAARP